MLVTIVPLLTFSRYLSTTQPARRRPARSASGSGLRPGSITNSGEKLTSLELRAPRAARRRMASMSQVRPWKLWPSAARASHRVEDREDGGGHGDRDAESRFLGQLRHVYQDRVLQGLGPAVSRDDLEVRERILSVIHSPSSLRLSGCAVVGRGRASSRERTVPTGMPSLRAASS